MRETWQRVVDVNLVTLLMPVVAGAVYSLLSIGLAGWVRASSHFSALTVFAILGIIAGVLVFGWFGTFSDTRNDRLVRLRRSMTRMGGASA